MTDPNEEPIAVPEDTTGQPVAPEPYAQLRYVDNSGRTDTLFHVGVNCIIGRHDPAVADVDVDLSDLPDSKFVSRKHARIYHEEEKWMLAEFNSANGTFLYGEGGPNFVKVSDPVEVKEGDEIVFGNLRFRFEIPPPFQIEEES
jgi:pSer/pThr/pTyr-binding forkhead associated (FHA) protein